MCVKLFTNQIVCRRTVAEIQGEIAEQARRNPISRAFHAKGIKDMIAGWRSELGGILDIFNVRSFYHFLLGYGLIFTLIRLSWQSTRT